MCFLCCFFVSFGGGGGDGGGFCLFGEDFYDFFLSFSSVCLVWFLFCPIRFICFCFILLHFPNFLDAHLFSSKKEIRKDIDLGR